MPNDTEYQVFTPAEDTAEAQAARFEQSRQSMHEWIDNFPGLSDGERVRRKAEYDQMHEPLRVAAGSDVPPVKTAEQLADERLEASFNLHPIGDELAGLLENELERIAGLPHEHAGMRADLVRHYGSPEAYARVVGEAKSGWDHAAEPWRPAMELSRHFLDVVAQYGRANAAYAAARR